MADTTEKPKRTHKPRNKPVFRLVELSKDGKTGVACYVEVPLPPGTPTNAYPKQIEEACRNAVYKDGQRDYGNRALAIIRVHTPFQVNYVERMALLPPDGKEAPAR